MAEEELVTALDYAIHVADRGRHITVKGVSSTLAGLRDIYRTQEDHVIAGMVILGVFGLMTFLLEGAMIGAIVGAFIGHLWTSFGERYLRR